MTVDSALTRIFGEAPRDYAVRHQRVVFGRDGAHPTALELAENFRDFECAVPDFHRVWYDAFESGASRILLVAPREHAKTSTILTYAEARQIRDRNLRIGIVSKTEAMAKAFLAEIKYDYESNERLIRKFGRMMPARPRAWGNTELIVDGADRLTGKDTSIFAIGVGGQVTGRHCDLLLIDDIETMATLRTPEAREATRQWFAKELVPVLDAGGQIIVAYTRKHEDDVYAHLEADSDKPRDDGTDAPKNPTWTFLGNATRAILPDGEALWPEHWPLDALDARRAELDAVDLTAWSSEYMNEIIPAGTRMFEPEDWPTYEKIPASCVAWEFWDVAISEKTSADYSVGVGLAHDLETNDLYLFDIRRGRWNFNDLQAEIAAFGLVPAGLGLHLMAVGIEAVAYQVAAVQEALRRTMLPVVPVGITGGQTGAVGTPEGLKRAYDPARASLGRDKVSRARLPEARARAGKIFRPANAPRWWAEFVRELKFFPKGTHDDQVDALSGCTKLAADAARRSAPMKPQKRVSNPIMKHF